MRYTQKQWDKEIGWGLVPPEYAYERNKMSNPLYDSIWNPWHSAYKNINVTVTYNMKEINNVYTQDSDNTRTNNRNDKPKKVLRNTRGK
jgi:hypothetical protein|tara:strand:- start:521 stop:787 length:267 start_codon:yes stop_codon:yes gene_type:complete